MKTSGPTIHPATLHFPDPLPDRIPAGTEQSLQVALSCETADLPDGLTIWLKDERGRQVALAPLRPDPESGEFRAELTFRAPADIGQHDWMAVFPALEGERLRIDSAELPLTFATRAHRVALTVWQLPSPALAGESCRIRVGGKCLDGCDLSGQSVHLLDDAGAARGETRLGKECWPGTSSLYWAELDMTPPETEGDVIWAARLDASGCALPHEAPDAAVRFRVVPKGRHKVTVCLRDRESGSPVPEVGLRIGPYRGKTDALGNTTLGVAPGTYKLSIWKPGYEPEARELEVEGDLEIEIDAIAIPEEDPDAMWGP